MANLEEDFLRSHINRMAELNSLNRPQLQELDPKIAGIVKKLQENPSLIQKVELFISNIPVEEVKSKDNTQLMS